MKQMYLEHLLVSLKKGLLLIAFSLAAFYATEAQVYTARLSGAIEAPPNASPGTGNTTVTITGTSMRVQASFTGLLGNTTVAHIHAPTPTPGTGTAGVATTTPTFLGFPAGVQAGTYDNTLDMTLASSYNPAFITANGGTPASAFAALYAAINTGRSYLNIHSNLFPGGEIRGFLVLCPAINVTIPDALALPIGALPNTVYPAYAPAASLTLSTNISGGTGPYTYSWSNGSTAATTTVSPTVTTTYNVTVKDQNACPGTATKTVSVVDVTGGKKGDKIMVCHKGSIGLTVAAPAVAALLAQGGMLGSCAEAARSGSTDFSVQDKQANGLAVTSLSNPSPTHFTLSLNGKAGSNVQLRVYDLHGRMIESKFLAPAHQMLRIGSEYQPGIYIVEVVQGTEKKTLRLLKSK